MPFGQVVIPEEVNEEVFKRRNRVKPAWIKIQTLTDAAGLAAFAQLRNVLDRGESAAIALAGVFGATVLIDEALGSEQCSKRNIPHVSTAAVVAKLIADLRVQGVYVS